MSRLDAYRELVIVLVLAALATGALFAAGVDGWRGRTDDCLRDGQCFCERDRGGLVRQPANTLSNLGFVVAGAGIALHLGRARRRGALPRPDNPMTATRFYPGAFAAVAALLGPGSMALHASLTWWGSVLDLVSMNVFISLLFAYAVQRWAGLSVPAFVALYVALNAALLAVKLGVGRGSEAFGVMAAATLVVERRIRRRGKTTADARWLAAAVGVFLTAFAIWLGSHNDGPLCRPDSWLQGHGVWHLLGAVSAVCLYAYLRSERPLGGVAAGAPAARVRRSRESDLG